MRKGKKEIHIFSLAFPREKKCSNITLQKFEIWDQKSVHTYDIAKLIPICRLWKYNTASEGWMNMGRMGSGCLCQVTSLRKELLQQNESYFHNLYIIWNWLSCVTSLDTFLDLKPRTSEVWTHIYIIGIYIGNCFIGNLLFSSLSSHSYCPYSIEF